MFSGLPLRTTNTTTESSTMPLYSFWFQSSATRPASTRRFMSGSSEKWTTSAGWPASTARDWSPEAPNEFENSTPSPSEVVAEAGLEVVLVDLLRGRVGDEVDRAAGAAAVESIGPAARGDSERERAGEGGDGEQPGTAAGPRVRQTVVRAFAAPPR